MSKSGPVVAVIPARFASTRLPGKPLLAETGKTLVQHVWERVRLCGEIDRILVATDDDRIAQAVRGFGGEAVMTSSLHPTGTDRVAEAVRAACIRAAQEAFEQASMSGLCCEGAWEVAVGAMQTLDLGPCTAAGAVEDDGGREEA